MYRPLPNGLTIKQSGIEGLGLFATKDIEAGTVLGIAHVPNANFPHGFIRTALGAFYNHSNKPNCILTSGYWQHMEVKYLIVSKDVKSGNELTAKYSLYNLDTMNRRETDK